MTSPTLHPPAVLPLQARADGWTVSSHSELNSTNLAAASLSAWHAVRADRQTAGRGRFQRTWVSDEGGLWLSAVVPVGAKSAGVRLLPLAAGLAVCDALRSCGVGELRMRWPNDVLVQNWKLAGLLIDQFVPGLAVVGIGINVCNQPDAYDPSLRGKVTRLTELLTVVPTLPELMAAVLASLRSVCLELETAGPDVLLPRINALWQRPNRVQLDLDTHVILGEFDGVDSAGRLSFLLPEAEIRVFEPHEVRLLREII